MFARFLPILTKFKALKVHGRMLWHAFRHADTPKWIKGFMLAVVVYLFSPIDLIPDFLVILGLTDDLVVISAAMWLLGKVVPEKVKNSLPQTKSNAPSGQAKVQKQAMKHHKIASLPAKSSPIKSFGLVLLRGLLLAALASHPWVQTQFATIR